MKRLTFFLVLCILSFWAYADSLITMSKDEADKLMTKLKSEKYLFSYCDCCNMQAASLVQIASFTIEKAQNSEDLYAIRVVGTKVMVFSSDFSANFSKATISNEKVDEFVSLNQSMIAQAGRGLPLGYFAGMSPEKVGACADFIYYPHSSDNQIFESVINTQSYKDYHQWYQSTIQPALDNKAFIGVWEITFMCENMTTCKEFPSVMGITRVTFEENGKAALLVGKQNDKGTWKLENGKLIVKDNNQAITVFGFRLADKTLLLKYMQPNKTSKEDEEIMIMKLKRI